MSWNWTEQNPPEMIRIIAGLSNPFELPVTVSDEETLQLTWDTSELPEGFCVIDHADPRKISFELPVQVLKHLMKIRYSIHNIPRYNGSIILAVSQSPDEHNASSDSNPFQTQGASNSSEEGAISGTPQNEASKATSTAENKTVTQPESSGHTAPPTLEGPSDHSRESMDFDARANIKQPTGETLPNAEVITQWCATVIQNIERYRAIWLATIGFCVLLAFLNLSGIDKKPVSTGEVKAVVEQPVGQSTSQAAPVKHHSPAPEEAPPTPIAAPPNVTEKPPVSPNISVEAPKVQEARHEPVKEHSSPALRRESSVQSNQATAPSPNILKPDPQPPLEHQTVPARPNVNEQNDKGRTRLVVASGKGDEAVVNELLARGANVAIRDLNGRQALHHACRFGHARIVEALLQNGAEVDAREDTYGATGLMVASQFGHAATVRILLQAGANPNLKDHQYERTPLIAASMKGHVEVVNMLLRAGANINTTDGKFGATALIFASDKGFTEVARLLLSTGADVNIGDAKTGRTALIAASRNGHYDVVQQLLSHGAPVNATDNNRKTAIGFAVHYQHSDVAGLLRSYGAR